MLSDVIGPLRVLYLVHALPPCEVSGPPLIAHAYAKRTAESVLLTCWPPAPDLSLIHI